MRRHDRFRLSLCLLLIACCAFNLPAHAAEPVLNILANDQKSISLTEYFAVLEDPSQVLTLSQVLSSTQADHFNSGQPPAEALSFGYTRSAYWLRLTLKNDSDLPFNRMLEISEPGLTSIQFHQPVAGGVYQSINTGRLEPFTSRPFQNRLFVFPLSLPAQTVQTFYVRIQSVGPVSVPARLWEPQAFYAHERSDYSSQAWYFGMAMAMALFNLLLFIALRDVIYLLYVNFVTCMALTLAIQNNLDKEYFWNDAPFWSNIATNVGYSLTLAALLVFMRKMLNTRAIIPRLDRLLQVFIGFFLLTPLLFAMSLQMVIKSAALLYGVAAILILVTGVLCAFKRQRSAYFFVAAFAMLCFAAIITVLRALGFVPTNLLTINALQFGSVLEMLLLAFALADRFNVIRREKEKAQNEVLYAQQLLVESLQSSERALEERVEQRTAELDKKNEKLKQAMRSLEDVERIARHDLKTPLVSIVAAPNLLRAGRVMELREERVLKMIEHAATRALNMINLSLDLYQMETGNYLFRPVSVDLTDLLLDVTQDLAVHAQSKSVTIQVSGHQPPVFVAAEDALCYSMIANLMKNAVEAAPLKSTVSIRVQNGERVILRIHNQGAVPESLMDKFFAKYATSGKIGGTGLGTYSSYLLAKIQGGNLTMESSEEDGTTLIVELNRADAPLLAPDKVDQKLPATIEASAVTGMSVRRVLLVDDDDFNQMIMSELIPQPPLLLDTALNGRLALEQVMKVRPDFIIMDLEMPVMGGIEALNCIRKFQHEAGQVPSVIIAYSGNDDAQSWENYLSLGFDQCLSKPCTPEEIAHLLLAQHS